MSNIKNDNIIILDENSDAPDVCEIDLCNLKNSDDEVTVVGEYTDNNMSDILNEIHNENILLSEFIECCLELDPLGMRVVVKQNLLPLYKNTNQEYLKSKSFEKVLTSALCKIKVDPSHKYNYIRNVCETLKLYKDKKRVQLTTLATNIHKNSSTCKRRTLKSRNDAKKSRSNNAVIDLGSDDQSEVPIIDLEDSHSDEDNVIEKENISSSNANEINCHQKVYIHNNNGHNIQNPEKENSSNINIGEVGSPQKENVSNGILNEIGSPKKDLLVPIHYDEIEQQSMERIKKIEVEIAKCNKAIERLEQQEVDVDSKRSPYLKCERLKAKVVAYYKELCELTGAEERKVLNIRLHVPEGHPPGPVLRLQEYLNKNVDDNGLPPFPDFSDVVLCVYTANVEDKLGWNKTQVTNEARSLFTQCGQALQKRRQQREWRDLMCRVKLENADDDPADRDPELLARLHENSRLARRNEEDVLQRFVNMQAPKKSTADQPDIFLSEDDDTEESDDDDTEESTNVEDNTSQIQIDTVDSTSVLEEPTLVKVKQEPVDVVHLLESLGDNFTTTIEIENPHLIIEISDSDTDTPDEDILN